MNRSHYKNLTDQCIGQNFIFHYFSEVGHVILRETYTQIT